MHSALADANSHRQSDAALVAAAQAGDREAFDELAARYRSGAMAVAFDFTGRFEVAEDLAQETLCRAWEKMEDLRDPEKFGPWLRSITVNCYRMWQRRPFQREVELAEAMRLQGHEDFVEEVRRRDLERELRHGLQAIPRQNRIALLMRHFGGASYEEIASFLDVPKSTVEGRIYRAKLQLRRRLARLLDDEGDYSGA